MAQVLLHRIVADRYAGRQRIVLRVQIVKGELAPCVINLQNFSASYKAAGSEILQINQTGH